MCILIAQSAGNRLNRTQVNRCWYKNKDGAGYAWAADGVIHIRRFLDKAKFYRSYLVDTAANPNANFLVHFRYGTQGTGLANVHPFEVKGHGLVFGHNGIISEESAEKYDTRNMSDTRLFEEHILRNLQRGFLNHWPTVRLIEKYIGSSKLLFLDTQGQFYFVNEQAGHWKNGNWWSNYDYDTPIPKPYTWPQYNNAYSFGGEGHFNSRSTLPFCTNYQCVSYWGGRCCRVKGVCENHNKITPFKATKKKNRLQEIKDPTTHTKKVVCDNCGDILKKDEIGYCEECMELLFRGYHYDF